MLEKAVVSYGYIPEKQLMHTNSSHLEKQTTNSAMNFTTSEDSYGSKQQQQQQQQQHKQNSSKKNTRRRVEQSRNNRRCSDPGSDTGSDGVAVNSGGSGRSGDWGPPKIRQKQKYSRRRTEQRASFTDSGISLAKTDSGDFSELSNHIDPIYEKGK